MYAGYKARHTPFCINCYTAGHISRQCPEPIYSYGCIAFRVDGWNQPADIVACEDGHDKIPGPIKYLMIQRRESIGFVEFMRGKYRVSDLAYVEQQIEGMTMAERERLLTQPFDVLWDDLWGVPREGNHAYRNERDQARQKLDQLRNGNPSLEALCKAIPAPFITPEWGFPKGRRDMHENEYACAMREFREETNISPSDVQTIRNLEPLSEVFRGTNSVRYCHKYFIAYTPSRVADLVCLPPPGINSQMSQEVGDIRWCSLEECLALIRPINVEKRNIILRVDALLKEFYPVRLG
jgi:8-oxo-dGTP pyrophosphatase MutT (NUDIX family)